MIYLKKNKVKISRSLPINKWLTNQYVAIYTKMQKNEYIYLLVLT